MVKEKIIREITATSEDITIMELALKKDTYLMAFDVEDNYYFNDFESEESVIQFIEEKGFRNIYQEWLDFICSDGEIIESDEMSYYLGRVIESNKEQIIIHFEEKVYEEPKGPFLLTFSSEEDPGVIIGLFDKLHLAYQAKKEYVVEHEVEPHNIYLYEMGINEKTNILV